MDLSTVRNRDRLKARREPYWHKLANGQFLGFRPSTSGGNGTWIARAYDAATWRNRYHALGDFGELAPSDRFGAAKKEAQAWLDHVTSGGSHKPLSVKQACELYAQTRPDAAKRFARYVYHDPIARVPLHKLTRAQVKAWRDRLENRPALVTRRKTGRAITRERNTNTVNRDMVAFRAALNAALQDGHAQNALAWKEPLKPAKGEGRRNLYLDRDQRRAFLECLPEDAAAFARGLCLLPLRPGALAALRVGDFDARRSELSIERDKAGEGRRILLPANIVALLKAQSRGKLPGAHLFTQADGRPWNKDAWKGPVKDAVQAAKLPPAATAYTLRHSTITDLVTSGLDLFTVAQVSGTSVAMIERHYGHLQRERAAEALATLAL